MDLALAIDHAVPCAQYSGSCTANNQEAFEALTWLDARQKPTWEELLDAWSLTLVQSLCVSIAARRYEAETSGTTVEGIPVNTERDSQALLTGAALQAMLDPNYTVRWKTEGGFVDLDAQQIIDLASAVRAHVQACFDREAELVSAVEDDSYTESMLNEGWP